jgi:hypothetical protein
MTPGQGTGVDRFQPLGCSRHSAKKAYRARAADTVRTVSERDVQCLRLILSWEVDFVEAVGVCLGIKTFGYVHL